MLQQSEYSVFLLWLKPLVLDRKRILYRVYIRELDEEYCTRLSTLYTIT